MLANPQLSSSFIKSRNEGLSDDEIRKDALMAGWNESEIDAAFEVLGQIVTAPINKQETINNVAKENIAPKITPPVVDVNKPIDTNVVTPIVTTTTFSAAPISKISDNTVNNSMNSDSISKPVENNVLNNINIDKTDKKEIPSVKTMSSNTNNFSINKQALNQPKKGKIMAILIILFVIFAMGGTVYAYVAKIGPFAGNIYKEDNFASGILAKISQIESATYGLKFELYTKDREADAHPFNIKIKDDPDAKAKFDRDSQRIKNVSELMQSLKWGFYGMPLPESLKLVEADADKYAFEGEDVSSLDPLTNKTYLYNLSKDKKDFQLEVDFETDDAIKAIKSSYSFSASSTKITGKKVVFTKNSNSSFYLEPSLTFWETVDQYSEYIPPEIKLDAAIKVISDQKNSEWKIDFDGNGDLGDLTYKINFETLKKAKDYYFRINNIPSLFTGFLPPKNQWVKFTPSEMTATSSDSYSGFISASEISDLEKTYKEQKKSGIDLIKKIIKISDEEKVFAFKEKPYKEKIGDRSLYRYDLRVRKEAVLPFYKKVIGEIAKDPTLKKEDIPVIDEELVKFLESSEFSETYDYYDKSVQFTLWTDMEGYPVIVKYSTRVVPSDKAKTFKDKQIMFDFTITLDDINKPVEIKTPEGSKKLEDVMKENYPSSEELWI